MPLDSVVVSAWLSDVQTAENCASRKRLQADLNLHTDLRLRKRRALVETVGNTNNDPERSTRRFSRRRGPRKPADALVSEDESGRTTSCDAALNNFAHPILSPSSSSQYTVAIPANTASADGAWDAVSAGQKSKNSGRRPPSPTKTVNDMEMLDKPIRYCYHDKDEHPLPLEIGSHWQVLETLCNDVGIIPASIEACLTQQERVFPQACLTQQERVFPHMVATVTPNPTPPTDVGHVATHQIEFTTLMGIRDAARECSVDGSYEPGWNGKVHQPLLSCALEPIKKRFKSVNVTLAKPLKEFAPLYKGDLSNPKIVDFLITLKPSSTIADHIRHLLRSVPEEELRTINQTSHTCYEPAVMSIETKRGHNDEDDAKFKLAMWTAAWQNQIGRFTKDARCTPLPGLIVFGHVWNLYWLVDLGTSVDVIKFPYPVGDTQTIAGCYRLVAVIRHLCGEWAENVFFPWFTDNVLP
ncbi:hypothetical protein GQ44DRAFT_718428 [Phaeosphaeriaceae sp. PMI808]|nr:hypothetical protein GQ44DRAFT_718428 [Phaeosphaeriaceae sp. PMI808]